ncbi:hypothetical protein KIN20_007417 [Parelaphostrongylus tenuis]|uniref:Uncharacterized protein n=1 Tax=Parelaphostrongylus tenuis TaxID=148309 RepID=A0AAD5MVI9_PARTN|nr:hypothetical protein KIN20_007417 [Parelaphostrongylus tenuis]
MIFERDRKDARRSTKKSFASIDIGFDTVTKFPTTVSVGNEHPVKCNELILETITHRLLENSRRRIRSQNADHREHLLNICSPRKNERRLDLPIVQTVKGVLRQGCFDHFAAFVISLKIGKLRRIFKPRPIR